MTKLEQVTQVSEQLKQDFQPFTEEGSVKVKRLWTPLYFLRKCEIQQHEWKKLYTAFTKKVLSEEEKPLFEKLNEGITLIMTLFETRMCVGCFDKYSYKVLSDMYLPFNVFENKMENKFKKQLLMSQEIDKATNDSPLQFEQNQE